MGCYIIDSEALKRNVRRVREAAQVPLIAVVKANGYGLGLAAYVRLLASEGIDWFAITEIDDVACVREAAGGHAQILLMRSTALPVEAEAIAANSCIATLGSSMAAQVLDDAARRAGVTVACHVKIDTGFGRSGFLPSQLPQILACFELPGIRVCGMYTHFSNASSDLDLTLSQLKRFEECAAAVRSAGFDPGMLHAANSPALFNAPQTRLDAVRIGSALLGRVITRHETGLERIGILEAPVIELRELPRGYRIGYGGRVRLQRDTRVAYVATGTLDGVGIAALQPPSARRALSAAKHARERHTLWVEIAGEHHGVLADPDLRLLYVDVTDGDVQVGDRARIDPNPLMLSPLVERVWE